MSHRIRAGDTDEHVVDERYEVRSKWGKIDKFLERFGRLLFTGLVAISTWFLANVVSPLRQIPALAEAQTRTEKVHESIDSSFKAIDKKLENAEVDRGRMVDILAVLAALQCDTFTIREQRTSKLCGRLLRGELP